MSFIMDDPETEKKFREILHSVQSLKNGDVAELMKNRGIHYKMNWGVSLTELRRLKENFEPDHLLAMKLWNKQWRETMILATMLDSPREVTEQQMDFWTKSLENQEIAEQASANLWVKTKYAFVKSLEWCRGKKHFVRFTGIHLTGRLALAETKALDEMFEPFFEEVFVLAKDSRLYTVLYRTLVILGSRSKHLNQMSVKTVNILQSDESENAVKLGRIVEEELISDYIQEHLKDRN